MRLGDERATVAALCGKVPVSTSRLHPMVSDLEQLPSHLLRAHLHGQQPGGHPLDEAPLPDRLGIDAGQVPQQALRCRPSRAGSPSSSSLLHSRIGMARL
jgi:hypothetical protein